MYKNVLQVVGLSKIVHKIECAVGGDVSHKLKKYKNVVRRFLLMVAIHSCVGEPAPVWAGFI